MKRNSFRAITDHEALRAEEIGRVGQGRLAAMTSWQALKMALIGATTAFVAATIYAPAVATPAAAAEFTRRPQANGPDVITIRGEIDADDYKKFIEIASDVTQASVVLNVKGGRVWEAIYIGRFIRLRNYDTRVQNGAVCDSACTLIWLAGTFRHLDRYARLGFHSAATTRKPPYKRHEEGNAAIAAYLAGLGVPQQVIDLQPKADPCCFNYVGHAQAKAWGLLSDRSAKQQQVLPTPETQQQVATAPAPPKPVITVPVRPTLAQPVLQQALPPSVTQQPVSAPKKTPSDRERNGWPSLQTLLFDPFPVFPPALLQPAQPDATAALVAELRAQLAEMRSQRDAWESIAEHLAPAAPKPEPPKPVPQLALPTLETQQPASARKKAQERIEPGSQQAAIIPGTQQSAAVAQKVVLYEEDPADPNGKRFVGSAIWRTETVTPGPGQPPELAIRADVEVPERKLSMTWSLRRNTDKGLPASHTVEIMFKLPEDFPSGGVSNVPGMLMKQAEQTRGVPLAGLAVKVTPGFYLIGLSNLDADKERNLQLLKERGWLDIPVVYNNNRRAILAMEKGTPGERVFADAFKAWNVPSGTKRTVIFLYGANADCSPWDLSEVRKTKSPEHGAVEIVPGEHFAEFAKDHVRFKCNGKKMRSLDINYKSSAGYVGPDEFDLLVLWPNGRAWEMHFNINVR